MNSAMSRLMEIFNHDDIIKSGNGIHGLKEDCFSYNTVKFGRRLMMDELKTDPNTDGQDDVIIIKSGKKS